MQKLKKIGVISVAKVYGLIGIIVGFIFGLATALFSATGAANYVANDLSGVVANFGLLAIIIGPIVYGFAFFLMAGIFVSIANVLLKFTGGIELELE